MSPLDQSTPKKRSFWLDACRSVAIVMVLMSHGRHFLTPAWENASVLRIGGFLGVELFFVLSGFLIGKIIWSNFKQNNRTWVFGFMARRWLRTLPNYYLFVLVNAVLIISTVVPGRIGDLLPFMFFVQNLAWPHPAVFGEAWSLAVEEVFYLVLPICILTFGLLFNSKRTAFLSMTAFLLLLPLAARIVAVDSWEPTWDEGIRKVVVFRLDALMMGVVASWMAHELHLFKRIGGTTLLVCAGLILAGAVAVYFLNEIVLNTDVFARVWLFPMVSIGCALLLMSGLAWVSAPPVIGRLAEICARWSYALYLAHMPVFQIVLWWQKHAQPGNAQAAFVQWLMFIVGSVGVAAVVERFFERPILAWRDRVAPR